jgi:glycine/D-amino acid oxidase-like deaminating enzyme
VRVCVAGGGLAGSALAWRLAQLPGISVLLLAGRGSGRDATSVSGGAVRAYETLAAQRQLAIASMAELLGSPVLRQWARYRPASFVYVRDAAAELAGQIAEIDQVLPGSARLVPAAEAFGGGWAGPDGVAVVERQAGSVSPGQLRDALLADFASRPRTRLLPADLTEVTAAAGRGVLVGAGGPPLREQDVLVLAAGAWTPHLLRSTGYPAPAYRTRSIQFNTYEAGPWLPPPFADDRTGLYGKPLAGGGLALGVPVRHWGASAGGRAITPAVHVAVTGLARESFPRLRLGAVRARTSAVDCFCDPPVLTLRRVPGAGGRVLTFTGGSGSAAKTALAASALAAVQISELALAAR